MSAKVQAKIEKYADQAHELQQAGQYADAKEALAMVLSLTKLLYGPKHLEFLRAEMNLGVCQRRLGDTDRSIPTLQRVAEALSQRIDEPEGAYLYRMALNNLATSFRWAGRFQEAAATFKFCLTMIELAPPHDETAAEEHARVLDNIADVLTQQGELDAATDYARQGLDAWRGLRGNDDLDVAVSLSHVGGLLLRRGELDAARGHLERSLHLVEELAGHEHPNVGAALNLVAALETASGNSDVAAELYTRSIGVSTRQLSDDHPQVREAIEGLAELARRTEGAS